jgi:hypothetical protein
MCNLICTFPLSTPKWLKMSGNITFVDKQKINDIVTNVNDLKGSINTLKSKISNNEDIADSYFENVLTH